MKKLNELRSLVSLAQALGQTPDPELLSELERLEQREARIRSRVRKNMAQDLQELNTLKIEPSKVSNIPLKDPLQELTELMASLGKKQPRVVEIPVEEPLGSSVITESDQQVTPDIPVLENEETWAQRVTDEAEENNVDRVASTITEIVVSQAEPILVDSTNNLELKVKHSEAWMSRIAATGPGGGEVNLRWLDDIDRSSIGDGKYLNYNATTKKFQFSTLSGGATQLQSDWNQTDNTEVDYIKNKPDLTVYTTNANLTSTLASYTISSISWTNPSPAPASPWRTNITAGTGVATITLFEGLPGFGNSFSWNFDKDKITFPDGTIQTTAWTSNLLTSYTTNANLTSTLASYTTNSDLTSTLNSYATKTFVTSALTSYTTNANLTSTLASYTTNSNLTSTLNSYATNANLTSTLASYLLITDASSTYVRLSGSYANPAWITSLAYAKLSGAPATSLTIGSTLLTLGTSVTQLVGISGGSQSMVTSTTQSLRVTGGGLSVVGNSYFADSLGIGINLNVVGAIDSTTVGARLLPSPLGVNAFESATQIDIGSTSGTITLKTPSVVLDGDLQVKGGDITTNQAIFNLLNTAATTINAFGAATALTLGSSVGTTTINNNLLLGSGKTITTTGAAIIANSSTAFIAGPAAASGVALEMPYEGALRNMTNGQNTMYFDISNGGTTHGSFRFRSSNAFTELLDISTDGLRATTAFKGKTSFNVALDTVITVDNIKYRISNQGGVFPQIASAVGSTVDVCYSGIGYINGTTNPATAHNSGFILDAAGTWLSLFSTHGMDDRGDLITFHITDKNAGKIYRSTFLVTNNSSNTTGYNILVERII